MILVTGSQCLPGEDETGGGGSTAFVAHPVRGDGGQCDRFAISYSFRRMGHHLRLLGRYGLSLRPSGRVESRPSDAPHTALW